MYRFGATLSEADRDALNVFSEVNRTFHYLLDINSPDLQALVCSELSKQVETEDGNTYSLLSYMIDQGVYVDAYN